MVVYVLESLVNGRRYVGMAQDVEVRLCEHNSGKSKFTKAFLPWQLIYVEECSDRLAARTREKYLKTGGGRRFIQKLLDEGHTIPITHKNS